MDELTKQDVKRAFMEAKWGRNTLLYKFYKDSLFHKDFTAEFIAGKISEDLGVRVTVRAIYNILNYTIKKSASKAPPTPETTVLSSDSGKVQKEDAPTISPAAFIEQVIEKRKAEEAAEKQRKLEAIQKTERKNPLA